MQSKESFISLPQEKIMHHSITHTTPKNKNQMKKYFNLKRAAFFGMLLLAMLTSFTVLSQKRSSLMYDDKCRLRRDTALSITQPLCDTWSYAEANIAALLSNTEIPKEYLDNGFKPKHPVFASFECDSADISHIKVLNDTTGYGDAVKESLKKQGKAIAAELKSKSRSTDAKKYLGKYYVVFNFMLFNFQDQLRNAKAVPIFRSTNPNTDSGKE
jgi:hypothetical protein